VAQLERGNYDLILMDMQMPEMDGIAATQMIRALPGQKSRIPIIAMTANAMSEDRDKCLAAGMDDYLAKPIDRRKLAATLEKWVAKIAAAGAATVLPPTTDAAAQADLREDLGDAVFDRLVHTFAAGLDQQLDEIDQAASRGEVSAVAALAHSIKGTAGNLGFTMIAGNAAQLERAAKEGRAPADAAAKLRVAVEATGIQ